MATDVAALPESGAAVLDLPAFPDDGMVPDSAPALLKMPTMHIFSGVAPVGAIGAMYYYLLHYSKKTSSAITPSGFRRKPANLSAIATSSVASIRVSTSFICSTYFSFQ